MIRCQLCNKVSNPREKTHEIILEKRSMNYENEIQAGRFKKIRNSRGWETAKSIRVCDECYSEKQK